MTKRQISLYLWSLMFFHGNELSHLIYSSTNYRMECIWFFFSTLNLIKKRKEKKICNKLRLVENKVQSVIENFYGEIGLLIHAAQQTDFIIHREKGPTCSYTWNTVYIFFLLSRLINVLPMIWYRACRHILCIWATREMRFPHHPFTQACYKMLLAGYKSSIMAPAFMMLEFICYNKILTIFKISFCHVIFRI